ncbi:MAG: hypothetical protein QOJ79_808 [Actinomycetota bacterium]|jgi:hypothetical protein|nr:hypothetical protein [Actinomycetota bacterium]
MSVSVFRPAVAVLFASSVVVGGVAHAAPAKVAPVCNLVEDAKDDTFALRYQETIHDVGGPGLYGPAEPALDIVSADVAADAKTITAVLRVNKLAKSASSAPGGLSYRVQFSAPGESDENMYLSAATTGAADTFAAGTRAITANLSTKLADATGVFDLAKNEIRISVPLATFAAQGVKVGTPLSFSGLDQTSARLTPTGSSSFADVALSEKGYKVGTPSCVVPGK